MALRGRVPAHKTLQGKQKRNKNPKLSPFQREQKKDRLANGAPINKCKRDFPAKAREFQHYMNAKRDREAAKKEALKAALAAAEAGSEADEAEEEEEDNDEEQEENAAPSTDEEISDDEEEIESVPVASAKRMNKGLSSKAKGKGLEIPAKAVDENPKKFSKKLSALVSLNEENKKEKTSNKTQVQLHNDRIIAMKEKSQAKKTEKRKQRAVARNEEQRIELDQFAKKKKDGLTKEERIAEQKLEKQLRKLEQQEGGKPESGKPAPSGPTSAASEQAQERANHAALAVLNGAKRGKRSRDGEEGEEEVVSHKKQPKVKDDPLDEKIDHIRFGERVDAPPVFEKAPSAHKNALLPVHRMGNTKKMELNERKRLEKLGLLPAMAHEDTPAGAGALGGSGFHRGVAPGVDTTADAESSSTAPVVPAFLKPSGSATISRPTTAAGFEEMRLQVLERYNKKRAPSAVFQPGDYFANEATHGKKRRDR